MRGLITTEGTTDLRFQTPGFSDASALFGHFATMYGQPAMDVYHSSME